MLGIVLSVQLLSLAVPKCPALFKAVSLGRRWAYEDIHKLEEHRDWLTHNEEYKFDREQIRFERLTLRYYLLFLRRLTHRSLYGN